MNSLFQNPMRLLFGVVVLLVILSQSLAIVPEDKQALILRFGEIEGNNNPEFLEAFRKRNGVDAAFVTKRDKRPIFMGKPDIRALNVL